MSFLLGLLACCIGLLFKVVSSANNPTFVSLASVEIFPTENYGTKSLGVLTLKQYRGEGNVSYVEISGELSSILPAGLHGFHVHEKAPVKPTGCTALGSHYNPMAKEHSSPNDTMRHVGDLGNVKSDAQGIVMFNIRDSVIQIGTGDKMYDVAGKAIAIHVGTDDLGMGGTNVSKITGNAGKIMACGSIVLQPRNLATPDVTFNPIFMSALELLLLLATLFL